MASPLLEYANTRLRVVSDNGVSFVNGRPVVTAGSIYLIRCYLKRAQYTGVTSGSKKIPLPSELGGLMLPGASGDQFYYRGYALQKAVITSTVLWETVDLNTLTFTDITTQEKFLLPGTELQVKLGNEPVKFGTVERSSGEFGGTGIDTVLYEGIGGVQIQITAGDLQG